MHKGHPKICITQWGCQNQASVEGEAYFLTRHVLKICEKVNKLKIFYKNSIMRFMNHWKEANDNNGMLKQSFYIFFSGPKFRHYL